MMRSWIGIMKRNKENPASAEGPSYQASGEKKILEKRATWVTRIIRHISTVNALQYFFMTSNNSLNLVWARSKLMIVSYGTRAHDPR
jgi:hypothetical protein